MQDEFEMVSWWRASEWKLLLFLFLCILWPDLFYFYFFGGVGGIAEKINGTSTNEEGVWGEAIAPLTIRLLVWADPVPNI